MTTIIKITELEDIDNSIDTTTLVPVVNMNGTPITEKANLQIIGDLILNNADGITFPEAANAIFADNANVSNTANRATYTNIVINSSQPNITSVGTLVNLQTTGNIQLASNISIEGNIDPLPATDTEIAFKVPVIINNKIYYLALTEDQ